MKVSIVTISYNQARFLEKALCSVVDQDYPDIEYIVVDPGSTDGSREIIKKYSNKIDHIIFDPDSGPSEGLNKGFQLASGDVFGFLNSDDYLLPGAISQIVDYFCSHQKVDVVSGNAIVVDQNNAEIRKTYSDIFSILGIAYGFSTIIQPSTFFRKQTFLHTSGFDNNNHSSWDYELFVHMKLNGAVFRRKNFFLSAYRVHEESITGTARLNERLITDQKNRFIKIIHRERYWFDIPFALVMRAFRYLTNPRDIIERILKGPINGRFRK